MKKYISLFLCLTCVLTLVACGKKADPITLPQIDEITSVDITVGENTVSHSDKTWISEMTYIGQMVIFLIVQIFHIKNKNKESLI